MADRVLADLGLGDFTRDAIGRAVLDLVAAMVRAPERGTSWQIYAGALTPAAKLVKGTRLTRLRRFVEGQLAVLPVRPSRLAKSKLLHVDAAERERIAAAILPRFLKAERDEAQAKADAGPPRPGPKAKVKAKAKAVRKSA